MLLKMSKQTLNMLLSCMIVKKIVTLLCALYRSSLQGDAMYLDEAENEHEETV